MQLTIYRVADGYQAWYPAVYEATETRSVRDAILRFMEQVARAFIYDTNKMECHKSAPLLHGLNYHVCLETQDCNEAT